MIRASLRLANVLPFLPVLAVLACRTPSQSTTCESHSPPANIGASAPFPPAGPAVAADVLRVAPASGARAELLLALADASIWQLQMEGDRGVPPRVTKSNERLKVRDGWCEVLIDGALYDGVAERVLNIPRGSHVSFRAGPQGLTATHWIEGNLDEAPYVAWTLGEMSQQERKARAARDLALAVGHELRAERPGLFSLPQALLTRVCAEDLFSQIRIVPSSPGRFEWTVYGVRRSALAGRLGIENGDRILELNGVDLAASAVPFDAVGASCGSLSFLLKRGESTFGIELRPR